MAIIICLTKIMKEKLTLLLVFLIIPVIAYIAALGVGWQIDSMLRKELLEVLPNEAQLISNITVSSACDDYEFRSLLPKACGLNDEMELLKFGAALSFVVGIGLLILIKIAGKAVRGKRSLLLLIFKPGLHLTMLTLSLLMTLNAILGIAAIYYGESVLINRVHFGAILALSVAALFGVISMIRAQFSMLKKAATTVLGKNLDSQKYPTIWKFVTDLAKQMGAEKPDAIVAGLEPNFYVTEANVTCLDGKLKGKTMYVSIPLCRILSVDEVKAVLGHELAHYKGLDTRFSRKFYPIYRGATQGLVNISEGFSDNGGAGQMVLLPAFMTLSYFLNSFSDSEKEISREREVAADSEATKIEGTRNLAIALVKLNAFSAAWDAIKNGMQRALGEGKQIINASSLFAEIVEKMEKAEALGNVAEEGPIHPTDTHPPLSQRLANLKLSLQDVVKDAENTSPKDPAVSLLDNLEELEKELTDIEHVLMLRLGRATINNQEKPTTETTQP